VAAIGLGGAERWRQSPRIRGLSAAAATSRLAGECVVASYCSIAMNFRFSAELPVKDLSSSDRRL
jgi:hypothetical protein